MYSSSQTILKNAKCANKNLKFVWVKKYWKNKYDACSNKIYKYLSTENFIVEKKIDISLSTESSLVDFFYISEQLVELQNNLVPPLTCNS